MMVLFNVQMSCRQRAAVAALALPMGRLDTPCVRLARCRSWAGSRRLQGLVKTEGKIKGSARACLQSQSARGVAAARRLVACVPSRGANPGGIGPGRVPSWMRYAALRWSWCHGFA
jgi:hypothetical protein